MNRHPSPSTLRLFLQAAFTAYCIYVGWRFAGFLAWATGATHTFTARPASVEAFLPISAYLGFRRFVQTGLWDGIHPAGLAIFCLALLIAIALRKGFCGYICPVGFVHNLLERLGRKLNATRRIPRKIATVLLAPKYLLLAFFTYTVWFSMPLEAVERFMRAPYNLVADAKMLLFFMHPSATAIAVFAALAILGAIFPYFWCRFLCPYGALLGIGALLSPLAIKRRADECIDCGKCDRACPGGIQVSVKDRVNSAECVGCMQCTGVCPTQCLDAKAGSARIHPAAVAVAVVGLFLAGYAIAELTGHWDADFAPQMLKRIYMSTLH